MASASWVVCFLGKRLGPCSFIYKGNKKQLKFFWVFYIVNFHLIILDGLDTKQKDIAGQEQGRDKQQK